MGHMGRQARLGLDQASAPTELGACAREHVVSHASHHSLSLLPRCPRSKLPTHHPEDRNSVSLRGSGVNGSGSPASPAGGVNGCAPGGAGGAAAEMVAATSGTVGSVDPKAQDLQFLFLAMTEEVGAGGCGRPGPLLALPVGNRRCALLGDARRCAVCLGLAARSPSASCRMHEA